MSWSRWKVMAGILGVSLGGLATVAGQCPKPDSCKSSKNPAEMAISADVPAPAAPQPPPPASIAPAVLAPSSPMIPSTPPAPMSSLAPPAPEPLTPSSVPSFPAPAPMVAPSGPLGVAPSAPPAAPVQPQPLPVPVVNDGQPKKPDLPAAPPVVAAPAPMVESGSPAFSRMPQVGSPQAPLTPPEKPGETHPSGDPFPSVDLSVPRSVEPQTKAAPQPAPAVVQASSVSAAALCRQPVYGPPEPPVVQASSVSAAAARFRIVLRVGEGEPKFEVRNGDDLILKVVSEKVDVKSPEKGNGLSSVKASGKVHFVGFGAEGTCDELSFLAGNGEVTLTGNVKIQVKDKLGRVESELTTETVKYRIDGSAIAGSLKP